MLYPLSYEGHEGRGPRAEAGPALRLPIRTIGQERLGRRDPLTMYKCCN